MPTGSIIEMLDPQRVMGGYPPTCTFSKGVQDGVPSFLVYIFEKIILLFETNLSDIIIFVGSNKIMARKARSDKGSKRSNYNKVMSSEFRALMNSANSRSLAFDITETYWNAMKANRACYFCGGRMSTLVLKREDRGYVQGNILACCATCEYHKVYEDWEELCEHMQKVYQCQNFARAGR